mgnify:CR=1 FL=1
MNEEHPRLTDEGRASSAPNDRPSEIQELLATLLREQRRDRRRRRLWRAVILVGLVAIAAGGFWGINLVEHQSPGRFTAVVQISGIIGVDQGNAAWDVEDAAKAAFESEGVQGVILAVNSPGGSPVQSGQIFRALRKLSARYPDTPLYAVISDIGASGGYYAAVAAQKIFVDPSSIVGSIGVVSSGFGFVESMEKLGIERRLATAGDQKAMLDPFSPMKAQDQEALQSILDSIHLDFVSAVKEGRGARLGNTPELFSGKFWTGRQAVALGLADGMASVTEVAEEVIGAPQLIDFSLGEDWWAYLIDRFATGMVKALGISQRLSFN